MIADIEIYCSDAIQKILELPQESVQSIVTSPPWYGKNESKAAIDVRDFRTQVFQGFAQILKPDGVVFWDTFSLSYDLDLLQDWNIIESIKWGKSHLLCFSKSKNPLFHNPYGTTWGIPAFKLPLFMCMNCGSITDNEVLAVVNNTICIWTPCSCGHPEYALYSAAFPEEIPTRCILMGSKENDIILDPFCGSGTTALACLKLGRKGIMIDKDSRSCGVTQKRVEIMWRKHS